MSRLQGAAFLIQETNPEAIFISDDWNEEQQMLAEMIEDFCQKEILTPFFDRKRELEADKDLPEIVELLNKAGELGLCSVGIEEAHGGMDLDFASSVLFSEKLALGFSFATTLGAQTSIGSLPIVYYGNDFQKEKYLPKIATGELKAAYCLTEPNAGSDANSGRTKAILSEDGKNYLITGQKMWITNGGFADVFIVFAKIDEDENLSAFIIEKDFGGITIGKEEKKLGIKSSSTVQLFFDKCPVPVENLLGEREEGFKIALNILNVGRIKLGGSVLGGAKHAIDKSVQYANEREQFKKKIASFGAIKHKLGEMASQAFVSDAALYRAANDIEMKIQELKKQDFSASKAKLEGVRTFAIECAILKVKASECLDFCIDEALQIHGGMGYAVETGIEMGYRDARITRIYEGTNEINRLLSIGELSKRAIKTREIDLMTKGKKMPAYVFKEALSFQKKNGWKNEKKIVENLKALFLIFYGTIGKKLKEKLIDEQEILMNLADILGETYYCESAILKIEKLAKRAGKDEKRFEIQKQMAQVYLYEALDKVRKSAKDALASYANKKQQKKMNRILKILLKPYDINPKEMRRNIAAYLLEEGKYGF